MFLLLVVVEVLSAFVIFNVNAARILCVFPTPSFSHQIVYRSLTRALAGRGHDVVVITTHPFPPGETPANLTEIDVYEVSHRIWQVGIRKVFHEKNDDINIASIYFKMFTNIFEKQIQSKAIQDLIKNKSASFDLLILESSVLSTVGLISVLKAPAVQVSTFGPHLETYSMFGVPTHPFLYPTSVHKRLYNISLWEAIHNLYKTAVYSYVLHSHEREDNKMLQRNLGSDILPLTKLNERLNLYLQTVYPIWMNNPPVPRGIVYLGGLHQTLAKSLPQNLQTFLDSSSNGIIYVSFGSNVHPSLLCQEKINMMARVFSNLTYEVLWKRDQNIQTETGKNVFVSTWFPQSDLLHHPKIKLFITQGGLQSTEEAINAGVPLVGILIFGDQWMHTENYVHLRIGVQLDWNVLSEKELARSIAVVIEDKSYKENVLYLRNVMNDQPQSALDRAVWWTEYVLKHGGTQHLRPASANISWLQYYEVELILIVVVVVIFVVCLLSVIVFKLLHYICRGKTHKRRSK